MFASTSKCFAISCIACLLFGASMASAEETNTQPQSFSSNITVDQSTGGASTVIPIFTPEGRRGIHPAIALAYSSSAGNGPFGYGWFMNFGSISRSTKKGVPTYSSNDTFICNLGTKSYELVQVGANEYRARVEEDMLKFSFTGSYWIIKDRRGTSYFFGSRPGSNIENNGRVFKWRLDKVIDLLNNLYVIDYHTDGSFEVRYVLKAGMDPATADLNNAANFAYVITSTTTSPIGDDYSIDYRPGFAIKEKYLTYFVTIKANGNRMKKYQFNYSSSLLTGRSFLIRITEWAADNTTSRTLFNIKYSNSTPTTYNVTASRATGDSLWNCQFGGGYDRGHDNYGPVPGFDVDMGPVYTKASGVSGGVSWSVNNNGRLTLSSGQDQACQCWTYVYVNQPKTISLSATSGGEWGIYLNGSTTVNSTSMSLAAGYNLIFMTDYHQHESFTFDLGFDLASQVDFMNSTLAVVPNLSGDFNGDGRMDVATFYPDTGKVAVALSNGGNFLPQSTWISNFGINQKVILGDFNGDGSTDIAAYDSMAGSLRVALSKANGWSSTGKSFSATGVWASALGQNSEITTGDFDGDGYTDLLVKQENTALKVQLWLNNRSGGFTADTVQVLPAGDSNYAVMTGDFNADGLADIYAFKRATGTWVIFENTDGHGTGGIYHSQTGFGTDRNPVLGDFNGDGRTDIAYYDWPNGKIVYKPATRRGSFTIYFGATAECPVSFSLKDANAHIQFGDYNGDGLPDVMASIAGANTTTEMAYSYGTMRDLMVSLDNAHGGKTDISYQPSTAFSQKNMPFILPLVTEVAVSNLYNSGEVYKAKYSYTGGQWDPVARDFMGFATATIQDAYGAKVVTRFNVYGANVYFRGRPMVVSSYDRNRQLISKTKYNWSSKDYLLIFAGGNKFTASSFIFLDDIDQLTYDTPTSGRRIYKDFVYQWNTSERFGDLVKIIDYGDVDFSTGNDMGNDRLTTDITYTNNLTSWILGLPQSNVITDQTGNIIRKNKFTYDPNNGLILKSEIWNRINGTDQWVATQYRYDEYGNPIGVKDALGRETVTAMDAVYKLFAASVTNPVGQKVTLEYYGVNESTLDGTGIFGQLKMTMDTNLQKEWRTYDVWGRPLALISPLDNFAYPTTTWEYNTQWSTFSVVATKRRIISGQTATLDTYTYYDGLGRVILSKRNTSETDKYVVSGLVSYDLRGAIEMVYPSFYTTESSVYPDSAGITKPSIKYIYDDQGRIIQLNYQDGSYETRAYDSQSVTTIDANGHKQRLVFDAWGRVIAKEEYTGADGRSSYYPALNYQLYATTQYIYDAAGNMKQVIDAKGKVTTMTYDDVGSKIAMNDPDMHNMSYEYNALGQLTKQTDARNVPITFTYDALGRPLSKVREDDGADQVTYTYDMAPDYGKGRLAQVNYLSGSTSFNYDAIGEEITSSKVIGSNTYNVTRTYDALGRIQTLGYPDGKSTALYGYNTAGQINSVQLKIITGPNTTIKDIITGIVYTPNDSISQITYGNGAVATYSYNPLTLRLQSQVVKDINNVVVQSNSYTYDPVGNIVQMTDNVKGSTKVYTYDALNRLISSNDRSEVVNYQYDQVGNIIQKGSSTYTYGQNGAGPHAVTSLSDGTTMTYDANGNITVMTTLTKTQYFTYDTYNRLIQVEAVDAGTTVRYPVGTYTYDGDGGRTTKTTFPNKGVTSITTNYVGEIYENTSGKHKDYILLGRTRIAAYDGTKLRWLIGDYLGSTNMILDETSAVTERIEYSPWGEVNSYDKYGTSSEVAWLYFTGKELDDETGLVFFGARYYNPKLMRFLTADLIVQSPYNPQTLNRYTYCNNNPINLVDPTGYSWKSFFKAAVDNFNFFSNPFKSDPLIHGIVTGDWSYAARIGTAAASSFVFSGFNPITAASAAITEVFMTSPMGAWTADAVAHNVFDNALGLRPGTAYVWSSTIIRIASTLTAENVFKNAVGSPATKSEYNPAKYPSQRGINKGFDPAGGRYPGGAGARGFDLSKPNVNVWALTANGQITPTAAIGEGTFGGGLFLHVGASSSSVSSAGMERLLFGYEANPLTGYLTYFGVCHQASNATLLDSGISSTVWDLTPHWSTKASTIAYGNYGGQSPNYVYSGIEAVNGYEDR